MKQLIEDLISAMEYHVEQTRPVHMTTVAIQAAREALKSLPAQQEPVAWGIVASNTGRICQVELDADEVEGHNPKHIVPLYTAPQPVPVKTYHDGKPWPVAPKPWVGLTDEDLAVCGNEDDVMLARYWERVLKEKNT